MFILVSKHVRVLKSSKLIHLINRLRRFSCFGAALRRYVIAMSGQFLSSGSKRRQGRGVTQNSCEADVFEIRCQCWTDRKSVV